jgi:GAF domain-containing protein
MADTHVVPSNGSEPARFIAAGQFGTEHARWRVQSDDQPVDVAAAVLHHELIVRLRERRQGRLSAATLQELTGGSERTSLRLLNGQATASLADMISWVAGAGSDLLDGLSFDLLSLLPPHAPSLPADWQPGQWRRPAFTISAEARIDWDGVVARLRDLVENEELAGRARLLTQGAIRHVVLTAITDEGLPAGFISVDAALGADGDAYDLVLDTGPEVEVVGVGCHLSSEGRQQLQQSATEFLKAINRTAAAAADRRSYVAVMSGALLERLQALGQGLSGAPGSRFFLTFKSVRELREAGTEPVDLEGVVLAQSNIGRHAMLAWPWRSLNPLGIRTLNPDLLVVARVGPEFERPHLQRFVQVHLQPLGLFPERSVSRR